MIQRKQVGHLVTQKKIHSHIICYLYSFAIIREGTSGALTTLPITQGGSSEMPTITSTTQAETTRGITLTAVTIDGKQKLDKSNDSFCWYVYYWLQ